MHKGLYPLGG